MWGGGSSFFPKRCCEKREVNQDVSDWSHIDGDELPVVSKFSSLKRLYAQEMFCCTNQLNNDDDNVYVHNITSFPTYSLKMFPEL